MRSILCAVMMLFSTISYAEQALPPELFKEIQAIVKMEKGDVIYVDFWASWCNPCRKSFPWMNAMQEKYKARGFKILAINVDKEKSLADSFLQKVPTSFQIYYDPEGRLAKAFRLKGMPSSFMLDDQGIIKIAHKGFFKKKTATYEQEIFSLIQH